jgi:demethylmenaquinone methyltransferase/2-methoxy-6-polyprenyl-1,4-benzoquinol methylase
MINQVVPYTDSDKSKKEQVSEMFDDISPRYDLLNRLLSMGIDKGWRKTLIKLLEKEQPETILDIATGTADLAIAESKIKPKSIIGVDISEGMLAMGREKVSKLGLAKLITLETGDSENLKFANNTFDAVTVAFGVRNFEHLKKGLEEMNRVLKPGGSAMILEFSQPQKFPFKQIYFFYFRTVLPLVGKLVSGHSKAYTYLPESVASFPYGKDFAAIMKEANFKDIQWKALTFGICTIYTGKK